MPKVKFQNRGEWLGARQTGIGASEVAGVLRPFLPEEDRCKWSSPYKIWCEKTGVVPPKDLGGIESVEWGLRHEPAIAQAVMDRAGRQVVLSDEFSFYRADDKDFLTASPDAFQKIEGRDDPGNLQIKTASFFVREEWENGCPMPYQIQCQAEMRVTGCRWGSLVVLIGGNRLLGPFDFERNDDFLGKAEAALEAFWQLVLDKTPPEIDGCEADEGVIKSLYKTDNGESVDLGAEWIPIVDEWRKVNEERKASKKREDALKAKLMAALGPSLIGALPDGRKLICPTRNRAGYTVEATSFRQLSLK